MLDTQTIQTAVRDLMNKEGENALLVALSHVALCKSADDAQGYKQWYAIADAIERENFLKSIHMGKA